MHWQGARTHPTHQDGRIPKSTPAPVSRLMGFADLIAVAVSFASLSCAATAFNHLSINVAGATLLSLGASPDGTLGLFDQSWTEPGGWSCFLINFFEGFYLLLPGA